MIALILIFLSIAVISFSVISAIVIFYHFKRFTLSADPNVKKVLNIFKFGTTILILLNFFFLTLNLF